MPRKLSTVSVAVDPKEKEAGRAGFLPNCQSSSAYFLSAALTHFLVFFE